MTSVYEKARDKIIKEYRQAGRTNPTATNEYIITVACLEEEIHLAKEELKKKYEEKITFLMQRIEALEQKSGDKNG